MRRVYRLKDRTHLQASEEIGGDSYFRIKPDGKLMFVDINLVPEQHKGMFSKVKGSDLFERVPAMIKTGSTPAGVAITKWRDE